MRNIGGVLFIFVILLASLLLTGCESDKIPEVKHSDDPLWKIELEGANPEFVKDYIYLWDILENEYPMLPAAERITGKNAQEVKDRYYKKILTCTLPEDFFRYVVSPCLAEFGGTGHLAVINDWLYESMCALYLDNPKILETHPPSKYNYEQLTSAQAERFYYGALGAKCPSLNGAEEMFSYNLEDNLNIRYFPESSAGYVKIKRMNTYDYEDNPEYNELMTFFEKLENEDYENCIIDIRGNGGGNSAYWLEGLVKPNLNELLEWEHLMLIKGDVSKYYLSYNNEEIRKISELSIDNLPNLNKDDLTYAQYFLKFEGSASPEKGKDPAFSGRFWLLVDEGNYSSSEKFVLFCKQTGFATIVGTSTGGDGIGVDPIVFFLPNTGICLRFSAGNGLNSDGSCNEEFGTTPDYVIGEGEDALEKCLELID